MKLHMPSLVLGALAAGLVSMPVSAGPSAGKPVAATYAVSVVEQGLAVRSNLLTGESWLLVGTSWQSLSLRED